MRGVILNFTGDPEAGLEEMELAMRLNPNYPHWYLAGIGRAYFLLLERYEEAIPYLERLVNAGEEVLTFRSLLAASYMAAGQKDRAHAEISTLLESYPGLDCKFILSRAPLRDEKAAARYKDLLRTAGLPE